MMNRLFLIFLLLLSNALIASEKSIYFPASNCDSTHTIFAKKRLNFEVGLIYAEERYTYKQQSFAYGYGGLSMKLNSDYYFSDHDRINGFFKVTWFRAGIGYSWTPSIHLTPLNIGVGAEFKLNTSNSLELSMNGGLLLMGFIDWPDGEIVTIPILVPELKYRHNNFSVATEFSYRKTSNFEKFTLYELNLTNQNYSHYFYYGLNFELPI